MSLTRSLISRSLADGDRRLLLPSCAPPPPSAPILAIEDETCNLIPLGLSSSPGVTASTNAEAHVAGGGTDGRGSRLTEIWAHYSLVDDGENSLIKTNSMHGQENLLWYPVGMSVKYIVIGL